METGGFIAHFPCSSVCHVELVQLLPPTMLAVTSTDVYLQAILNASTISLGRNWDDWKQESSLWSLFVGDRLGQKGGEMVTFANTYQTFAFNPCYTEHSDTTCVDALVSNLFLSNVWKCDHLVSVIEQERPHNGVLLVQVQL